MQPHSSKQHSYLAIGGADEQHLGVNSQENPECLFFAVRRSAEPEETCTFYPRLARLSQERPTTTALVAHCAQKPSLCLTPENILFNSGFFEAGS
jgi:hypothetical protein